MCVRLRSGAIVCFLVRDIEVVLFKNAFEQQVITELQHLPPEQLGPGATYRIIANPQRVFLKTDWWPCPNGRQRYVRRATYRARAKEVRACPMGVASR
jgi:hypothetical protein